MEQISSTRILRQMQNDRVVIITNRGKPVATLKNFHPRDLVVTSSKNDNLDRELRSQFLKDNPEQFICMPTGELTGCHRSLRITRNGQQIAAGFEKQKA